jgi:aryl-alcohol dehydrogenase-like predicted oxidoreductase
MNGNHYLFVAAPIAGPTPITQLAELVAATKLQLSEEDIQNLDL